MPLLPWPLSLLRAEISGVERFAIALSLAGLGNLFFYGSTTPEIRGSAIWLMGLIAAVLLISFPLYARSARHVRARVGRMPVLLGLFIIVALPFDVWRLQVMDRWDILGASIAICALVAALWAAFMLSCKDWWLARLSETLQIAGFAMIAGAFLLGYIQIASALMILAALLTGFRWFVFGRVPVPVLAMVFLYVIPIAMILSVRVDHLLAVPLIMSFLIGFAISLSKAKARSLKPPV